MVFKLVVFTSILASLEVIASVPAALYGVPVAVSAKDCDPPSLYQFGYDVADSLTGDYKSQVEQRNGDVVQGQYSLVESDGTLRVVQYTADAVNGFNAVVRNEPLVAEGSFVAEPAVVPTRITAAPVVAQPAVSSETFFARYTAAAIAAPVVGPAAILPRYEVAPAVARLVPAPVVSSQYGAPVTTTFNVAYGAPVGSQYIAEVAAPFAARIAAEYPAYSARYAAFSTPVAAAYRELLTAPVSTPPRAFYTGPAPVAVTPVAVAPVAVAPVEVTPAKLVESTDTDAIDCA